MKAKRVKECEGAGAGGSGTWDRRSLYSSTVKSGLLGGEGPLAGDARLDSPSLLTRYVFWTGPCHKTMALTNLNAYMLKEQQIVIADIIKSESPGMFPQGVSLDSDFEASIPELLCSC